MFQLSVLVNVCMGICVGLLLSGCATPVAPINWDDDHGRSRPVTVSSRLRMLGGPSGLVGWRVSQDGERVVARNALLQRKAYPLEVRARYYPDDWLQRYDTAELSLRRLGVSSGAVRDLSLSLCGTTLELSASGWSADGALMRYRADLTTLRQNPPRGCEPAFVYQIELQPDQNTVEAELQNIRIHFLPSQSGSLSERGRD